MIKSFSFVGRISNQDSELWTWSTNLFERVILPTFSDLGYEFFDNEKTETDSRTLSFSDIKQLVEDDLVVFDLTNNEPEVFYKLAIRHILQKPVLHVMREEAKKNFFVDGMQILTINIDTFEEIEISKQKIEKHLQFLDSEVQFSLPYVAYLQKILAVFANTDSSKNRDAIFNLLDQFENINASLSYAKEDLVVLSDQLIYGKQEPSPSPFVERRLAKAELIGMRKKGPTVSGRRSARG